MAAKVENYCSEVPKNSALPILSPLPLSPVLCTLTPSHLSVFHPNDSSSMKLSTGTLSKAMIGLISFLELIAICNSIYS